MEYERRALEPMTVTVADSRYAEFASDPCPADKPVSLPVGFTADEVERMRRERERAVTVLEFGSIPDSPSGHFDAHEALMRACSIAVTNAAHPIFACGDGAVNYVPMIDWERVADLRAHECAVMTRALQMAKAKIARLEWAMAVMSPTPKPAPSTAEAIAAALRLPTVPGAYGR